MPIFGAWIGDVKIGRYRAIMIGVLICGVSHIIQIFGAFPIVLQKGQGKAPFLISLFMLSIGAGKLPALRSKQKSNWIRHIQTEHSSNRSRSVQGPVRIRRDTGRRRAGHSLARIDNQPHIIDILLLRQYWRLDRHSDSLCRKACWILAGLPDPRDHILPFALGSDCNTEANLPRPAARIGAGRILPHLVGHVSTKRPKTVSPSPVLAIGKTVCP